MVKFGRELVVYVPAYNCASSIVETLRKIPSEIALRAEILVVDNCSSDGTSEKVREFCTSGALRAPLQLIRTKQNVGYSGSQKLAYGIVSGHETVRSVIMLHGDGQYPPELLSEYLPYLDGAYGVVYGYRSKKKFGQREETPLLAWSVIRALSILESAVTGHKCQEWHSGFVMYSTKFLRRLNLDELTGTRHIDGHLQFEAGCRGEKIKAIPIYKLYNDLVPFDGAARRRYVMDVLRLMFEFRSQRHQPRSDHNGVRTPPDMYELLLQEAPNSGQVEAGSDSIPATGASVGALT